MADKERPLNDRGKRDAPDMAKRTRKRIPAVDLFVSSDAKRARKTAYAFAEEYGLGKDDVRIEPTLYEDFTSAYDEVIKALPEETNTVAFFAHSPTITEFANGLTTVRTDNIPTCGVFAVQANCEEWAGFADAEKAF